MQDLEKQKTDDKTQELNRRLDGYVLAGKRRMSSVREMARDAIRYVYGDQHAGKKRKRGWEYPVINRMYADMMQEIAILSANNPRIDTPPMEDTDVQVAQSVGMCLKGVWINSLNMRIKIIQGLMDDHLEGIKIAKWFWEPQYQWDEKKAFQTGRGWRGKIEVNIIKPENFGCDPNVELAAEIPTKARFCHTERWVDKKWAEARWPAYKKYRKEKGEKDSFDEGGVSSSGRTDETHFNRSTNDWSGRDSVEQTDEYLQSRLADLILGERQNGDNIEKVPGDSLVKVQEIYFKDYEMTDEPDEKEDWPMGEGDAAHIFQTPNSPFTFDKTKPISDDNGTVTGYEQFKGEWPQRVIRPGYQRPKYPNGRVVIRLNDELIVYNEPWEHERWPFAVSPMYLLPHMWQGPNCVELSRGFQDWMNKIGSHLTNYIKFFGDPQLWIEEGALAKDKKRNKSTVSNWAGGITRFVKGALTRGAAKVHEPPQLPATIFQIFDIFKNSDQDLKGVHDVAQGRASKGNTLGELDMLNRNTRQRLAMQGALLDEWLKQIAWGIVSLMQMHYEVDQWVRWTGKGPDAAQASMQWTQDMADANFDIVLEPISTLPYDEEREVAKYLKAYEIVGPAMLEDVLEKMKIQNISTILEKHELIGPLKQLMEMSMQLGLGPQELFAALQRQLQMLSSLTQPAGDMNGQPGGQQAKPGIPTKGTQRNIQPNMQLLSNQGAMK